MESRLRPQQEPVNQLVGRNPHPARHEPVHRIRLVARAGHQAVVGRVHAGRAVALENENVERVESLEILVAGRVVDLDRQQPALGGLRIHIRKALEILRFGEFAEGGEPVRLDLAFLRPQRRWTDERAARESRAELQRRAAGETHRNPRLSDRTARPTHDSRRLCLFFVPPQKHARNEKGRDEPGLPESR